MLTLLKLKLAETLRAVAPLIIVICVLQVTVVGASTALFVQFLVGSVLVTAGLLLLLTGIDFGILPMGRFIGGKLADRSSLWLLLAVAFALGFATTAAEPDVLVLAAQVDEASRGSLPGQPMVYVIAAAVGLLIANPPSTATHRVLPSTDLISTGSNAPGSAHVALQTSHSLKS